MCAQQQCTFSTSPVQCWSSVHNDTEIWCWETPYAAVSQHTGLALSVLLISDLPSTVTKGFVYSSFLKPYNPRCSHSNVSVGSHSSSESEHSGSSSRGSSTPSSIVSNASANSPQKPPQDSGFQGDLMSSLSEALSEVDAADQPKTGPVDSAQPPRAIPASRRYSNPDPRNGLPARPKARATPSLENGNLRPRTSESKGNQVSAYFCLC